MAINFPNNPSINQSYLTSSGKTFVWTGNTWAPFIPPNLNVVKFIPKLSGTITTGASPINFDYWQFQVENSTNRMQIRTTDGSTRTIAGTAYYNNGSTNSLTVTGRVVGPTNWVSINPSWSFGSRGDTQWFIFFNEVTFETYRVTLQLQGASVNNTITIEKLWQ
jgi:hypothetical protein